MVQPIKAKMATQTDLNRGLLIPEGAMVDVQWLDACAHSNVDKLDPNNLQELLCSTHTIGRLVAQDNNVVCVASNISAANGADLIAIPKKWVKEILIVEN